MTTNTIAVYLFWDVFENKFNKLPENTFSTLMLESNTFSTDMMDYSTIRKAGTASFSLFYSTETQDMITTQVNSHRGCLFQPFNLGKLVFHRLESIDDIRVKMSPAALRDDAAAFCVRKSLFIGAHRGEGFINIHQGQDARFQRNVLSRQAPGLHWGHGESAPQPPLDPDVRVVGGVSVQAGSG